MASVVKPNPKTTPAISEKFIKHPYVLLLDKPNDGPPSA